MIKDGNVNMYTNKQTFARNPTLYIGMGEKFITKAGNSDLKRKISIYLLKVKNNYMWYHNQSQKQIMDLEKVLVIQKRKGLYT